MIEKVKKIILGTVQFGLSYGINNKKGKVSIEESHNILKTAYKNGIRTLDSAEAYGSSHQLIGRFHSEFPGYEFKVITKIPGNFNKQSIDKHVKKYLNTLSVQKLEGLMFHTFCSYQENPDLKTEIIRLKSEGLLNYFGVSIYTNEELKEVIKDPLVDTLQLPFNLLDNDSMRGDLLRKAKENGKVIHTRSTFLQGLFFMNPESGHPVAEALKTSLIKIQDLAKRNRISVGALALGYCLHQPYIDKVLIGVDSVEQLNKNLQACFIEFDHSLLKNINEIQSANPELLNPSTWN